MKLQKARKEHVCTLCGEKIAKDEKYWNDYKDHDSGIPDYRKEHISCPDKALTAAAIDRD